VSHFIYPYFSYLSNLLYFLYLHYMP
jgi:hypothetical protein